MEQFDFVNITSDTEELRSKNIFKGYGGVLISHISQTDEWIVKVLDPHNSGRYAVATIKADDLKFVLHYPERDVYQIRNLIETEEFYTHTELKPPKFKEYDHVRLLNDKDAYKREGVTKGMDGYILCDHAIMDKWDVEFELKPHGVTDFPVHQDDLELISD